MLHECLKIADRGDSKSPQLRKKLQNEKYKMKDIKRVIIELFDKPKCFQIYIPVRVKNYIMFLILF